MPPPARFNNTPQTAIKSKKRLAGHIQRRLLSDGDSDLNAIPLPTAFMSSARPYGLGVAASLEDQSGTGRIPRLLHTLSTQEDLCRRPATVQVRIGFPSLAACAAVPLRLFEKVEGQAPSQPPKSTVKEVCGRGRFVSVFHGFFERL